MNPTTAAPVGGVIPQGYNIVLEMYQAPKQIGSLYVPEEKHTRETMATQLGKVIAMGPDCFWNVDASKPYRRGTARCKVGDTVLIRSYTGTRYLHEEKEYRIIADDVVEAIVHDPASIRRAE